MGSIHKLIIEDDEGKTTVVPVSRGEISIGRMEGNTIRLMERNVSRKHARLLRENGAVFIEDLNSFNGVKINGERIDKRLEVKEGDLVEIGDYHLALQAVEIEEEANNRADTVIQPPRAPEPVTALGAAATLPAPTNGGPHGSGGHAPGAPASSGAAASAASFAGSNGKNEAWRQMATLPDFSVGEDVMRDARAGLEGRDAETANMRPATLGPPDPVVAPPPAKASLLPPFPASHGLSSPGGLAATTLGDQPFQANAGVAALRARDDAALRTEQIQVGPARISDVPRLVCVSTEYAGKDFPINRPEVVIGRVEDNDVVIEHRSVSRNHAKVLFDGRVHKIIDLQSANGILVNNEEYAITDLRKGDLIELGHVKFRFIPAGEPFAPTEDEAKAMLEAGVTPPPSGPGSTPAVAGAVPAPPVPAPRPLEPPTIPHKTQLDMRNLPGREIAGHRTEELSPSDTVEMPVHDPHLDPSTAATITDTPIDVLGGPAFQPRIATETPAERGLGRDRSDGRTDERAFDRSGDRADRSDRPTDRPGDRGALSAAAARGVDGDLRAARRNDTLPEPTAAPSSSLRVGGTAARRGAATLDDDADVRSAPPRSNRIIVAVGVVALLLAGLVVAMVKLGGSQDATHDALVKQLIVQGRLDEARAYLDEHWKEMSDGPGAMDALNVARERKSAVAVPAPSEPPPRDDPAPVAASPEASPSSSAAPLEAPPEGDEPAPPEGDATEVAASPSPGARRPRPSVAEKAAEKATAAQAGKKREQAKAALQEARSLTMYNGSAPQIEAALKKCVSLDDGLGECHYRLAVQYAKSDFREKAYQHYRRFLQLEPDASNAPMVRKILEDAKQQP